ncbi:Catenin alpha-1 [Dissostichus eleginoides]|nr:Catenin alpha-1 [Dissostichus eleginoides]
MGKGQWGMGQVNATTFHGAGRKDRSDALNTAIDRMTKKTRDLRRQLRKAVMDHVSDSFLETNVPLLVLIEAAKNGNEKEVKEYAQVFREHANKLIEMTMSVAGAGGGSINVHWGNQWSIREKRGPHRGADPEGLCECNGNVAAVANLACSISNNEEGVKLVRMAASQLEALCPQVINAALALAAKPNSKVAMDNMDLFKEQWEKQVRVLTDAVDDITSIDDFLCVSENHILEDVNKCVIALQEKDVDGLDRTAGAIRGRAARVVHVVTSEMDNYEPGIYTEKVLEATKLLTNQVMPRFTEQVESAVEALSANPTLPVDENEFIDASRLVYDGIRDIRKAVLMIRTPEELDDSDFETEDFDARSRTSVQTEDDQLIAGQSARAVMAQLPQEQRAQIAEQVASFQEEKSKLDAEVSKWDDNGNDIIVLAKQMCMVMMEMTDFTRGKGPLKNTSDVISAAKKIAEAGSRMDKLGRTIADNKSLPGERTPPASEPIQLSLLAFALSRATSRAGDTHPEHISHGSQGGTLSGEKNDGEIGESNPGSGPRRSTADRAVNYLLQWRSKITPIAYKFSAQQFKGQPSANCSSAQPREAHLALKASSEKHPAALRIGMLCDLIVLNPVKMSYQSTKLWACVCHFGSERGPNCPDSTCKQDLLAYLQRIALYCHQLNICSKVKAEVQNLGGELVVSGLDSAMSLIQAAKNLMNTVVSTVKASYVASTKYQKNKNMEALNMPAISWKMKAPEKKPLVKREKQDDQTNRVKRSSQKKHINPVQALSEFKAMDSI